MPWLIAGAGASARARSLERGDWERSGILVWYGADEILYTDSRHIPMRLARFLVVFVFFLLPLSAWAGQADAAQYKSFEVSGWIPYWRAATGTADALAHIDAFTEINPFVYTVKRDGTLVDNGKLKEEPWLSLRAEAKKKNIRFIPTITWGSGETIHAILSNTKARIALEDRIADLVKKEGFDGIDIDFEGKKAATRTYFSTFLKGLYMRMGNKWVMCTIEARTPLADRYFGTTPPKDATEFANDFKEINKYCDRVRIMAYDQQGIDLKLSDEATRISLLYAPVSDPRWVEKALRLAMKDISKRKIMIGIPTYGYEYNVTAYANPPDRPAGNEYVYDTLWTFNPGYAIPIASSLGIAPQRSYWGEMFFTYISTNTSTPPLGEDISALRASANASRDATAGNTNLTFRMMVWPDAESVREKVELAKRLGVRGVSIFKIDGGEDPNIWSVLK